MSEGSSFSGRTHTPLEGVIVNEAFYPDLELKEFQEQYRLKSEYREATIKKQLLLSIMEINGLLAKRREFWISELLDDNDLTIPPTTPEWTLTDVNCMQLGDMHEYTEYYKTAVYARAKAKLIPLFDSMNRRDRADDADDEDAQINDFMNKSQDALNLLLGECEIRATSH